MICGLSRPVVSYYTYFYNNFNQKIFLHITLYLTRRNHMSYCIYYQAKIRSVDCWFFVAALRSCEHVAFDRTYDTRENRFEFFVPPAMNDYFLEIIAYFQQRGMVTEFVQVPNRYIV